MAEFGEDEVLLRVRSNRRRCRCRLVAVILTCSFLIILILNHIEVLQNAPYDSADADQSQESFTIETEGCTIPNMNAFDENIKDFLLPPFQNTTCPKANVSLLLRNRTHIWVDTTMLSYYNVSTEGNFSCCYKSFYRPSSVSNIYSVNSLDDIVRYDDCVNFTRNIKVSHEFVKVSCEFEEQTVYEQFFLFAQKRNYTKNISKNNYNVIMMGLDGVSRLNSHRTMPKTLSYLKQKGAIELMGYNKVGDGTYPNIVAMLLGIKNTEFESTCRPFSNDNYENCPFIWKGFEKAGFYTGFFEDSARWRIFYEGFIKTPTDYFILSYVREAESYSITTFDSYDCFVNRHSYKVIMDYIEDLTLTLKNSNFFGFFWETTITHDLLNAPKAMDDHVEQFIHSLYRSNYLNNTVFVLLSDHGMRFGPIRFTKQGRLEERLPFVQILLPPTFREKYFLAYENLKQNSKRLTTPFDIHATLHDLITLDGISDKKIIQRSQNHYIQRGMSLFLPVPSNRTCDMAEIEDHWCTCHRIVRLQTNDPRTPAVAKELLKQLNQMLREHPYCAELSLVQVLEMFEIKTSKAHKYEMYGWIEFMIVVRTSPGNGIFEATLRRQREWSLTGTVSRLNRYENQSSCMPDRQLKLYCYCQSIN